MRYLWQDLRYGVRMLLDKPGFTVAALLVLALGIGANSAVFSLINVFLLKPIAISHPEELVQVFTRDSKHPDAYRGFSYPNYVDIRDHNPVFSNLAAYTMAMVGIKQGDDTRRAFAGVVSANYFATLGVALEQGRAFLPEDEKPGGELTAIVSYPLWKRLGGDPHFIGKQVHVNGRSFTVVGITPKGFTGTTAMFGPELFVPLGSFGLVMNDFEGQVKPLAARNNYALISFGRLKPGVTRQFAGSALAVVASQMEKAYAENKDQTLTVGSLSRMSVSTNPSSDSMLRVPSTMLLSLAAVVLLIASLNLANMMLARGASRRKEIAIRLAVGGGRRRIVQQLVTEGLTLALLGGAAGIFVSSWSTSLLIGSMARLAPLELVYDTSPDWRVVSATLIFCVLSTLIFSLFPAFKLSKGDVWVDLKENTGETVAGQARRLFSRGNLLVMAQLSLSLMMLTAAGLFVHSAIRASNIQPGFSLENGILAEVDASLVNYDQARGSQLYMTLKDRLRRVPGVQSVAIAATVPFGTISLGKSISPIEKPPSKDHPAPSATYNIVSEDYFQTLGIPLLRGRTFSAAESVPGNKTRVAIIDKTAAEKLWPGQDALGKHIQLDAPEAGARSKDGKESPDLEVVGVVGNVVDGLLGRTTEPHVYLPFGPEYMANVQFHMKVAAGSAAAEEQLLDSVRREIRATNDAVPLLSLKTMRGHLESGIDIWVFRTGAHVLEVFGSVALILAVIGLYAVNAYTVSRRTREIGIRMALGADAASTLRMVLGEGFRVTAVGIGVGLLLAIAVGRLLAGFLFDIKGTDPVVFITAPIVLSMVALLACYLPARRAARVDPTIALRYE